MNFLYINLERSQLSTSFLRQGCVNTIVLKSRGIRSI
jgi:hypothetical protein